MTTLRYIHRTTKEECTEKVYGHFFLKALYGTSFFSRLFAFIFLPLAARLSSSSAFYGYLQKKRWSRRKIAPFIRAFHVDTTEFQDSLDSFSSFNDFFIRKLKPTVRPIATGNDVAILPADGRYLVYENLEQSDGFLIKGHKFCLETLIADPSLASAYTRGSMVIARLAPPDYHRFHFPTNCLPEEPRAINGPLYSVNPLALRKDIHILSKNKRVITPLRTKNFGTILFIEIGATYVGSIHQTFIPHEPYAKGDEKGFFSFGGSCIVLLFEPHQIQFDQDLIDTSHRKLETLGKMGQSLGRALNPF